jgi:hypothetical protein
MVGRAVVDDDRPVSAARIQRPATKRAYSRRPALIRVYAGVAVRGRPGGIAR